MNKSEEYTCIRINAPELRDHPVFVAWLQRASGPEGSLATWHRNQRTADDGSDCFIWVERDGSSDSDMPEDVFDEIKKTLPGGFAGIVWLDFLGESPEEASRRILASGENPEL